MAIKIDNGIPPTLKKYEQWINWRLENVPGKNKKNKTPYQPNGALAKTNDSSTWSDYDTVVKAFRDSNNKFTGIGFVLDYDKTGLVFFDFDHCVDERGHIDRKVWNIVERLNSYTEFSQSGHGLHVVVRSIGELPSSKHKFARDDGSGIEYEVYWDGRYMATTGCSVPGTPTEVNESSKVVNEILQEHFSPESETITASVETKRAPDITPHQELAVVDEEDVLKNIARLFADPTAELTRRLFEGTQVKDDESVADYMLMRDLAKFTNGNRAMTLAMFNKSELAKRAKWQRTDYQVRTLDAALNFATVQTSWATGRLKELLPRSGDNRLGDVGYHDGCLVRVGGRSSGEDPIFEIISETPMYIAKEIRDDRDTTTLVFKGVGARDHRPFEFAVDARKVMKTSDFRAEANNAVGSANRVHKLTYPLVQLATLEFPIYRKVSRPTYDAKCKRFMIPGLHENDNTLYNFDKHNPIEVYPTNYEEALRCLLDVLPIQILSLTAVLACPFINMAYKEEKFGYALWGETGSLKTTIMNLNYKVYGVRNGDEEALAKYGTAGSTLNGLLGYVYLSGCLPAKTDNLKASDARSQEIYISLVQAVTEGADKLRASKDGGLRETDSIDSMLFVTGEVKPTESATSARVLGVHIPKPCGDDFELRTSLIDRVVELEDKLPGVGYDWLRFLETDPDHLDYNEVRKELLKQYQKKGYTNTGRLASIAAMMKVVFDLIKRSPIGEVVSAYEQTFETELGKAILEQGDVVTQESDLNRFLDVLRSLMVAKPAMFNQNITYSQEFEGSSERLPTNRVELSGWKTECTIDGDRREGLFLLPKMILPEVEKKLQSQGGQRLNENSVETLLWDAGYLVPYPTGRGKKYAVRSPLTHEKVRGWMLRLDKLFDVESMEPIKSIEQAIEEWSWFPKEGVFKVLADASC